MKELFPQLRSLVNAPMIMVNGEMLYDPETDVILCETPFKAKDAVPVATDILKKFPDLNVIITDGEIFNSNNPPHYNENDNWRMMTPNGDAVTISKCYDYIVSSFQNTFTIRRPSPYLIDMTNLGVNKGTRISFLRSYFASKGINDIKIYCVGDYENDTDMLLEADRAFCPANAIQQIKDLCHHILCDHDEGAICDLIEKIENNEI